MIFPSSSMILVYYTLNFGSLYYFSSVESKNRIFFWKTTALDEICHYPKYLERQSTRSHKILLSMGLFLNLACTIQ